VAEIPRKRPADGALRACHIFFSLGRMWQEVAKRGIKARKRPTTGALALARYVAQCGTSH